MPTPKPVAPNPAAPTSKSPVHRLESSDGRLAIEYAWSGDRFLHRLLVDGRVCLSSVDGDASESWPPSPPIQDVSLEPIQDVPMILGVGGAGSGHWSISVGWRDDAFGPAPSSNTESGIKRFTDTNAGAFVFDIACRSKQPPVFLGSTYRHETGDERLVEIQTMGESQLTTPTDQPLHTVITAKLDRSAATHRWIYAIGLHCSQ